MELTEVVSPSVAVPVLCVLVCAFLVFAFGFKSPAQPPSFDVFDDDGKKKRTKKSKGNKSPSNGHAVPAVDGDVNNSAKPQSSPRQPAKQSSKTQSPVAAKGRSAAQTTQEAPKKTKKQTLKEKEEEMKPSKKQQVQEDVDVDGWHTVPKKDKKQKKKENELRLERVDIVESRDSPVKEEEIAVVVKIEEAVVATCSASLDMATEMPGSPQEQRAKRKKEKKNKKAKLDEETVENVDHIATEMEIAEATLEVVAEPEPEVVPEPELEPPEPELEPEVMDANVIELQIKDAMESTMDDETADKRSKKYKKDKKKAFADEDDFVIPQAALEPEIVEREPEHIKDLPLKENTDALTVKLPKKKQKKDRSKRNEEKVLDSIEIGASGGVDSSLSQPSVSDSESQPKKPKLEDTSVKEDSSFIEAPPEASPGAEGGAVASDVSSPPQPTATFDELGGMTESWMEAKPKSKKKKARRAD